MTFKGHITLPPNPIHLLSFLLWSPPYLQPFHSRACWFSPKPQLFLLALLRSSYLSISHQSHTCGLQPVPQYLYTLSRSFTLHPYPVPTFYYDAILHLSFFHITHLLPKQFPIFIHILIHLPSKLLIYIHPLTFLFSSLYNSIHLSFASSSLGANTSFLLTAVFISSFQCNGNWSPI